MCATRARGGVIARGLCAVGLLLVASTVAAQTPKSQVKTVVRPSQAQVVRPVNPEFDMAAAKLPPAWSTPSVRRIIDVLLTDADSREMYTRSGSVPPAADVPAGSYATLTPIQMGWISSGERLNGSVITFLAGDYDRRAQEEADIAYIPIKRVSFQGSADAEGEPAVFYLHPVAAGWYLITLHLYNPSVSFTLHSRLLMSGGGHSLTSVLDRTDALPAESEYVLPALVEITEPTRLHDIRWRTEVLDNLSPGLVLRAVTVDKIG